MSVVVSEKTVPCSWSGEGLPSSCRLAWMETEGRTLLPALLGRKPLSLLPFNIRTPGFQPLGRKWCYSGFPGVTELTEPISVSVERERALIRIVHRLCSPTNPPVLVVNRKSQNLVVA